MYELGLAGQSKLLDSVWWLPTIIITSSKLDNLELLMAEFIKRQNMFAKITFCILLYKLLQYGTIDEYNFIAPYDVGNVIFCTSDGQCG